MTSFEQALKESRLRPGDLACLTGKDRSTVYRWRTGELPVPDYAWTIVRQQQQIKELAANVVSGR